MDLFQIVFMKDKYFEYKCTRTINNKPELNIMGIDLATSGQVENQPTYVYGRYANNTSLSLGEKMVSLYGLEYERTGEFKSDKYICQILSSGMACVTHLFYIFGSKNKDVIDECVLADDLYYEILLYGKNLKGWKCHIVNPHRIDDILSVINDNTRFVMLDSCAIPFIENIDMKSICESVHSKNPAVQVIVDNTSFTPYYYNPFEYGVDIVFESCTKYINGFGDAVCGSLILPSIFRCEDLFPNYTCIGNCVSPLACYLVNRGLMTLSLRMDHITETGCFIADWFRENTDIDVAYAGVAGVICFIFTDSYAVCEDFINKLKIIRRGYSFGMNISVVDTVSDRRYFNERRSFYLRFSVGLESKELLLEDLVQAWNYIYGKYSWKTRNGFLWHSDVEV